MASDSIVYEANAEALRVWNFNTMRTELHQPADGTHKEWKAGDWLQMDDKGRLTQLTEPPLEASANGADALMPVKATVPVIRVPDFEGSFGLSTAVDRNKRFFSPVVGPVDNFADASAFPENVLLDMGVFKCGDYMKNVIQKKHGIKPDWLFALKQQALPVTCEADEKYEEVLRRWRRPRREGVVLRSAGNNHVIGYRGEGKRRRLCVARDDSLTFGQLVTFYVIDVGFNAPVKFAAGCRPKDMTGLCQDGDQILVPRSLFVMGIVVLRHLGVIDVPMGFEGQESVAIRMELDLERGSVSFASIVPPRPETPPQMVTAMPRTATQEQVESRESETHADISEQTQTASSSDASASSMSQKGEEEPPNLEAIMAQLAQEMTMVGIQVGAVGTSAEQCRTSESEITEHEQTSASSTASASSESQNSDEPSNLDAIMAQLAHEMTMVGIQEHAIGQPSSAVTHTAAEHEDAEKDTQSSNSLPAVMDAQENTDAPGASEKSEPGVIVEEANIEVPEDPTYTHVEMIIIIIIIYCTEIRRVKWKLEAQISETIEI